MIIASQKRKENIAEYLLYMWQIEDIVRAYNFDIDKIEENIINKFPDVDASTHKNMREWYESIIDMMYREDVKTKGHIQLNKNIISALTDLHLQLIKSSKYPEYNATYYKTLPYIVELRAKSGEEKSGEIESCFNALYGVLMLRLNKKEVSLETMQAIAQISSFLALLSNYFKKDSENDLFTEE